MVTASMVEQNGHVEQENDHEEEILTFKTLHREGMKFWIDDTRYETVPPETFGGRQLSRANVHLQTIQKWGKKLQDGKPHSEQEIDAYESAFQSLSEMIAPDVPREELERLGDTGQRQLFEAFTEKVNRRSRSAATLTSES